MFRLVLLLALAGAVSPAAAADRTFTVTGFDRIRVQGPYAVTVVTGASPRVIASGDTRALDSVDARVDGTTLTIRRNGEGWGGMPGEAAGRVTIAVSTRELTNGSLIGGGALAIDRMRGQRIQLLAGGSGTISVGRVETDRLDAAVAGSGGIKLAGAVAGAHIVVRGAGDVDGAGLTASDADVISDGAGTITLAATRTARVTASGTGDVTVTGNPACTVRTLGSGSVTCGH